MDIFDVDQEKEAQEAAAVMNGSDQQLNECIEFGKTWSRSGIVVAWLDYERARVKRKREEALADSPDETA